MGTTGFYRIAGRLPADLFPEKLTTFGLMKGTGENQLAEQIRALSEQGYLDRDADFPYKIDHEDLCFKLFTEHGFEWGGDWEDRKDYQHFEIPTAQIEEWYPSNS